MPIKESKSKYKNPLPRNTAGSQNLVSRSARNKNPLPRNTAGSQNLVSRSARNKNPLPRNTAGSQNLVSRSARNWSGYVTKHSNALDLEQGVFSWGDPKKIAQSLKNSAEASERRKGTPLQSAMSMLNFYINRAGKNLKPARRRILEQAKIELRKLFKTNL